MRVVSIPRLGACPVCGLSHEPRWDPSVAIYGPTLKCLRDAQQFGEPALVRAMQQYADANHLRWDLGAVEESSGPEDRHAA